MQENPYSALLNVIRQDVSERAVEPWRLGRVVSVMPLTVELAGLPLTGSDLLVNSMLLGHTRSGVFGGVAGQLSATNDDDECAMSSLGVSGGSLTGSLQLGGVLEVGDQVVLLQSGDGQQYVVLCKVVSG